MIFLTKDADARCFIISLSDPSPRIQRSGVGTQKCHFRILTQFTTRPVLVKRPFMPITHLTHNLDFLGIFPTNGLQMRFPTRFLRISSLCLKTFPPSHTPTSNKRKESRSWFDCHTFRFLNSIAGEDSGKLSSLFDVCHPQYDWFWGIPTPFPLFLPCQKPPDGSNCGLFFGYQHPIGLAKILRPSRLSLSAVMLAFMRNQ